MKVNIELNKLEYYPGEVIKGNLKVTPASKVKVKSMTINIYFEEEWKYLILDNKYEISKNNQIISFVPIEFNKKKNNFLLEPKETVFPFVDKLADYLLPSFEYPQTKIQGSLRYRILANIQIENLAKPILYSVLITIQAIPKLDQKDLNLKASLNIKKWGLFNRGQTNLKVAYLTKNYKISDKIPIEVEVDNTKSKMKVIECKLKFNRKIILRDHQTFSDKYSNEENLIKNINKIIVNKKEKKVFNFTLDLNTISFKNFGYPGYKIPYIGNKSYKDLVPSVDGVLLNCEYSLTSRRKT